jgi:hypothetical protein
MTSVIRRVVACVGALVLLIVGVQLIGQTAASAHSDSLAGKATCEADGTWTVVWTVANLYSDPKNPGLADNVALSDQIPAGSQLSATSLHLGSPGSGTDVGQVTQTVAGTATTAGLTADGTWTDGYHPGAISASVPLTPTCAAPPPEHQTPHVTWANGKCDNNVVTQPSYTIPSDSDVTYTVGGNVQPAGTYAVPNGGTFHIVATPNNGVKLIGPTTWDFTLTVAPGDCGTTFVKPATPNVSQTRCVNHAPTAPTLVLTKTTGVVYTVDKKAPYTAGESVLVTAVATGNKVKFDNTKPGWPADWHFVDSTHATKTITFQPPLNCGTMATPAAPAVTQTSCPAGRTTPLAPTLTVPSDTDAVHYTTKVISNSASGFARNSVTTSYQPGQTVLVTATAQGTFFFATVPDAWTKVSDTVLTYTAHFNKLRPHECTLAEKATTANFTAEQCVSGTPKTGTYTVPSSTGVVYTANGKTIKAGTYPAAKNSKVTIVATAKAGYKLVGQTTWTHSFGNTPKCSNTAPQHITRPNDVDHAQVNNNNLASTGVPTENLVSIGFGLLIIGALSMLLATRRRDNER